MGRAGYWLGRAHEALGNEAEAAEAYALGAQYQSSFLRTARAGTRRPAGRPGVPRRGGFRQLARAEFTTSSVFHAALLLYEAGERDLSERFLTHLTESLSREEAGMLGDFALELGDAHVALRIAKRAAQNGHEIMRAYYPSPIWPKATGPSMPRSPCRSRGASPSSTPASSATRAPWA
jgi:soluble lytic murein transglycosylase